MGFRVGVGGDLWQGQTTRISERKFANEYTIQQLGMFLQGPRMNGLPYYKAYPRDFFEGTRGMAFEIKAAYRLLLDLIYMHGGSLSDEPRFIAGQMGCSVKRWNLVRAELIRIGKITVIDNSLRNLRADKELEMLRSFQDNQRKNASKPRKINGLNEAMAEPEPSQPEPEPYTSVSKDTGDDAAKIMFDSGIKLLVASGMDAKKARTLIGKWKSRHTPEAVLIAMGRAQREGAVEPVSFIEACLATAKRRAEPNRGDTRVLPDGRRQEYEGGYAGWVTVT